MKQKTVKTPAKSSLNGVEKAKNIKTPKKLNLAAVEDEELIETGNGKSTKAQLKTPAKVVPAKIIAKEEEEEDDDDDDSEDESGVNKGEQEDEAEEEDEADDNDEEGSDGDINEFVNKEADEQDSEEENEEEDQGEAEDNDSDDEEPVEAPIAKKSDKTVSPTKGGAFKIHTTVPHKDFPVEQLIIVRDLPKKFKQIDIVEAFAKFGEIHTIYPQYSEKGSSAQVGFTTPEAAAAAAEATNEKVQIKGSTIKVFVKKPNLKKQKQKEEKQKKAEARQKANEELKENFDRTMYIKNLKIGTTEEQVKEHFEKCGTIKNVKLIGRNKFAFGFITFTDVSAVEPARKLNNTVLNGVNIRVALKGEQEQGESHKEKDPKRTILLKNSQNLEGCPIEKIASVFKKCGEIENIEILCKKTVLAFVTFESEESVPKAFKMSGSTIQDLELDIEQYKVPGEKHKSQIFMQNVKPGVTEDQIRELFAKTGPVESVFIRNGFAIVKFQDAESFCKAFLLNESLLQGQIVFLEPYSDKKQSILKKQHQQSKFNKPGPPHFGQKRSFPFRKNERPFNKNNKGGQKKIKLEGNA